MADSDANSRASSPLSSAPSSPIPPPDSGFSTLVNFLPSPSASKNSSAKPSPLPDGMASGDDDGPPPAKKRKITEPKPRTTQYLDLRADAISEDERPQFEKLLKVLHKKRKIVVIAGAGISVSAGIPDFRSSTGLFTSLRAKHSLKTSGKHLFDASVYKDGSSTSSFHEMIRSLSHATKSAKPTAFHHLLARLAKEGRLLRLYSQNVDGIDTSLPPLATSVPLGRKGPWPKTIQLHGGLDKMVCSKCHTLKDFNAELFDGPIPPSCQACEEMDEVRTAHAGKRSHGIGRLRPRMVLYNEHNPDDEAIGSVTQADLKTRPDAVIVAGTTLKVPGVRRITREMCAVVRDRRDGVTIWINNDPEPVGRDLENCWDLVVRGPCDAVARHAAMRQWNDDPPFQEVTEEEVRRVQANGQPQVVVSSPRKKPTIEEMQEALLPTPAASPRLVPEKDDGAYACPSAPGTPTKSNDGKTSNPASRGRQLNEILGPIKAPKAASKKRAGPAKKTTAAKAKPSVPPITTSFNVSKPARNQAGTKGKGQPPDASSKPPASRSSKKSEPNIKTAIAVIPSPVDTSANFPQVHEGMGVFVATLQHSGPMVPVPPHDPRYNTFPRFPDTHPTDPTTSAALKPKPEPSIKLKLRWSLSPPLAEALVTAEASVLPELQRCRRTLPADLEKILN